jgi:hypothetical protein
LALSRSAVAGGAFLLHRFKIAQHANHGIHIMVGDMLMPVECHQPRPLGRTPVLLATFNRAPVQHQAIQAERMLSLNWSRARW